MTDDALIMVRSGGLAGKLVSRNTDCARFLRTQGRGDGAGKEPLQPRLSVPSGGSTNIHLRRRWQFGPNIGAGSAGFCDPDWFAEQGEPKGCRPPLGHVAQTALLGQLPSDRAGTFAVVKL